MRFTLPATIFVALFLGLSITVSAQSESRDQVLSQIEAKRAELAALEKKFLSPSEEDQAAYAELGWTRGDFPVSENAAEQILSLPMFAGLRSRDQQRVVEAVAAFASVRSIS